MAVTGSRDAVLGRIQKATAKTAQPADARLASYQSVPRAYVHKGQKSRKETLELLIERLREYDAGVWNARPMRW